MTEHRETWLAGDEDGDVLIVCERPACMEEGRWWFSEPVPVYHPTPTDIAAAYAAHLATHQEPA